MHALPWYTEKVLNLWSSVQMHAKGSRMWVHSAHIASPIWSRFRICRIKVSSVALSWGRIRIRYSPKSPFWWLVRDRQEELLSSHRVSWIAQCDSRPVPLRQEGELPRKVCCRHFTYPIEVNTWTVSVQAIVRVHLKYFVRLLPTLQFRRFSCWRRWPRWGGRVSNALDHGP